MVEENVEDMIVEKKISSGKPNWMKMKPAELEKIVVELAKKGEGPARIGMILRDKYGVPKAKLLGRRICEILDEKGIKYKSEEGVVRDRIESLKGHFGKNKKDYPASRALTKRLWVLRDFEKAAQL